jgi:YVTN family beta-propeller protein
MKKIIKQTSIVLICLLIAKTIIAQTKEIYHLDKKIALPGNDGFDYLYTDAVTKKLYVSHGTALHIIDLNTDAVIATIDSLEGVHGVTIVNKLGLGFITDGKNNAVNVFDINTNKVTKKIKLNGKKTDAIMYDAYSNQVFAFNNGSDNVSVIDVTTQTEKKVIELGGAPEFVATDGKGKIYNNLEDKNTTVIIDAKKLTVLDSISVAPKGTPTALVYDAKTKRAFAGCREGAALQVLDVKKKTIVATVPICKGVDAIVFDEATHLIFCSGDGTTSIIKQVTADKYELVQTITTKPRAKTLAIDKQTHKIYISSVEYESGTKKIVPNSFELLVYKMD